MHQILVLHGPNLNLLGMREVAQYGTSSLDEINNALEEKANNLQLGLSIIQSNAEHVLVDAIQQAKKDKVSFIIINPAAFTHTSIALRDAFLGVEIPFIEVHISNILKRETFRHHSYLSDIAQGIITGLGEHSYLFALEFCYLYLTKQLKR